MPGEITELLRRASAGSQEARSELLSLIYDELRALASYHLKRERRNHTWQPTELVHEAYLRLAGQKSTCQNRVQFFAIASQAMRRILVDYARTRGRSKRGQPVPFDSGEEPSSSLAVAPEEVLAIDEALDRLARIDPRQGHIVELRYFGGLTTEEVSDALGLSLKTVNRDWMMAKAWLHGQLKSSANADRSHRTRTV